MMLLVAVASAEGLPFECPAIVTAADAAAYRSDGGASAVIAQVRALAEVWEDYDCAWVETTSGDGETSETIERVCDDGLVRVEVRSSWSRLWWDSSEEEDTITVTVPSGETWTSLTVERSSGGGSSKTDTTSSSTGRAAWTGAIEGLPDDAWVEKREDSYSYGSGYYESAGRTVSTPTCDWRWDWEIDSTPVIHESVRAPDHTVAVWSGYDEWCREDGAYAAIDDVRVGAVDPTTWERNLADADGDGWPAGSADCDDADPARAECLHEVANDGVDQDCDGADDVTPDADRDGHTAMVHGGDDCDDADEDVFPGADDPVGDGLDQDCDGADDVDADGDGYTADGDSRPPDCDDADADVSPREDDVPYDGVDQDCGGEDDMDVDGDGAAGSAVGGPDCDDTTSAIGPDAAELGCDGIDQDCDGADPCPWQAVLDEDAGCGGGAAGLLVVVGLLGGGRRRRGPGRRRER